MTEKQYSGTTGRKAGGNVRESIKHSHANNINIKSDKELLGFNQSDNDDVEEYYSDVIKAGKIHKLVKDYAKSIIKKGMPLMDIAVMIDKKISELGAKPAFPVNLSLNEVAAHYTPTQGDDLVADGLLKVDIGIQVNGAIADSAFSVDLDNSDINKKLIDTSEKCLSAAINALKNHKQINLIGKAIQETAEKAGFSPIINLCGHGLDKYVIHSGVTIPNYDNGNKSILESGAYAIEPFVTDGRGEIFEGKGSGIYRFVQKEAIRDSLARQIIDFINSEYKTLPFAARWVINKFGDRAKMSLRLLEKEGIFHHYPQLVEKSRSRVAQAEHTMLINKKGEVIVTTE